MRIFLASLKTALFGSLLVTALFTSLVVADDAVKPSGKMDVAGIAQNEKDGANIEFDG